MKKAKIMLSTLVVLAIVGSALAFKVSRTFSGNLRCAHTTTTTTICTLMSYNTTRCENAVIMACTQITAPVEATCSPTCITLEAH